MSLNLRAGDRDRGRSEEEVPRRSRMAPALRRQLDDVGGAWTPTGRSRMTPARRRQCQPEDCDYTTVVGLATQDSVLKNLELHLEFHELLELHLRFHELEELDELWRENGPHKETNSGGRVDLTSKQTLDQDTKEMVVKNLGKSSAGPGRVEIDSRDKANCGGRTELTSIMAALQMIKNLLAGEMQGIISKENTKTPKHEKCGHYDLWLSARDVWTTASDVRRQTNFSGGSPARAFVIAHQRARCHRSQESARIGLAGGRGTQDIQSPGQSSQQDDYEDLHNDWRLPCNKHGTKGQTDEIEEMGETESETESLRSSVSTERTPLVKRWGSSEGSPQTQASSGWLLQV